MPESLTEMIVERFYRSNGYLVERDVPIVAIEGRQHWSDLDILAIKDDVLLINCKDFVSNPREKNRILENLNLADDFIRRGYPDIIKGKSLLRLMVYGGSDKATITHLTENGIRCIGLEEILSQYLQSLETYLDNLNTNYKPPKSMRWYRVGNTGGYDKLLIYLMNKNYLRLGNGKIKIWENNSL